MGMSVRHERCLPPAVITVVEYDFDLIVNPFELICSNLAAVALKGRKRVQPMPQRLNTVYPYRIGAFGVGTLPRCHTSR